MKLIIIRTSGDFIKASESLSRARERLPRMTRRVMKRWGKILERDMKSAAREAGIQRSTGELYGPGINYRQEHNSNVGYLFMRQYGVYLDSMRPHFVTVKRTRGRLLLWALMARNARIQKNANMLFAGRISKFSIFVRPHPFIASGYRRAIPKLEAMLKNGTQQSVAEI